MDSAFVASPVPLVALTVKFDVPAVVGLPEITPVVALSDKPAGRLPAEMLHVMGVVPVAARVWLYATPTVPPGREVVVMAGAVPVALTQTVLVPSVYFR